MTNTKRTLSGLMAIACIISSVGCGGSSGKKETSTPTADKVMEKAYKPVEMDCDVPIRYLEFMLPMGDSGNILIAGSSDTGREMYITDYEFLDFTPIAIESPAEGNTEFYYSPAVTADGTICALATFTDYGDFELPDYDDPDFDYENFDYEAMEKAANSSYFIYTFDSDGNFLGCNELEGLDKFKDSDDSRLYVGDVKPLGNDKLIVGISGMYGRSYVTVGTDGKVIGKLDLEENTYLYSSGNDMDGNLVFCDWSGNGMELKTIMADTMKVAPDSIIMEDANMNFNLITKGNDTYKLLLSDSTSLFGLTQGDGVEEIINWVDSDLNGDYITAVLPVEDGDFIVFERDWNSNTNSFYRLTKRDVSELSNIQVITVACQYADNTLLSKVKDFNKTHDGYRLKVEDYNKYYAWDEESGKTTNTPEDQLKKDLGAGKTYDILYMGGETTLFNNLASKGALVDMYSMMGTNGTVAKDDIVSPVLSLGEYDGKLVSLTPSFYVMTYAIKSKYCDKENWTIDDLIETYKKAPEGMKLYKGGNSKNDVFGTFIYSSGEFIDYEKGTCSFDSPEFIKVLNFCNEFDNQGEGDEINWETATNEEINNYYDEIEFACKNDKALLDNIYFDDFRGYARAKQVTFGEDITLVGSPSSDGSGARIYTSNCFAIMNNSSVKDLCWEFIASFFTEKYQTSNELYQIPALKSAFTQRLDDAMGRPYWIDPETGKKTEYDDTYYSNGQEFKVKPLTKEERDYVENYILSVKPNKFIYNNSVMDIIYEEIEPFFAGEKTAEETATIMQNRISILVSEQS